MSAMLGGGTVCMPFARSFVSVRRITQKVLGGFS